MSGTPGPTDQDLYLRGARTLVASWEAIARSTAGAALLRLTGVSAAVFPSGPERVVYNNALLDRDLAAVEPIAAVTNMETAYRSAGVDRYAAWVHESDEGMRAELSRRGYTVTEVTRAMGMALDGVPTAAPGAQIGAADWAEYLGYLWSVGVPRGLLAAVDPEAFHVLVARIRGETVAAAIAFDHEGDCGVYNVSTVEGARRRGIGTALTAQHVRDAAARGCSSASLHSTPVGERVYANVGFRDLGRILEYELSTAAGTGPG